MNDRTAASLLLIAGSVTAFLWFLKFKLGSPSANARRTARAGQEEGSAPKQDPRDLLTVSGPFLGDLAPSGPLEGLL